MIKTVGRPFGRAMHFDCHTCPGVEQPFSRFCAEEFAAELAAAHVDHIISLRAAIWALATTIQR